MVAGRLATTYPRQQHRVGRSRRRGAGTAGHDGPAGAAADLRRRRIPAVDRLRERRQPDAGAALEPARRDRGACRARRRTRAARAPGAGRKRPAVRGRRRARACSSRGPASGSFTRCPRAACRECRTCGSTAAYCSSRCWHRRRCALVFGARAGAAGVAGRASRHDRTRFPARLAEPSATAPRRARGRRGGAGA